MVGRPPILLLLYRGTAIERLQAIAAHGIDVDPPAAVFWATTDLAKALEYGGDLSKVVLVLDGDRIVPSFREVPADAPESLVADVERIYGADYQHQPNGLRYY